MWRYIHQIATNYWYVSVCCNCGSRKAVSLGSNKIKLGARAPEPTHKMIKHSTSTCLLKILGHITESFTIASNRLAFFEKKPVTDNFHFYRVLDTKKKECQNSSNNANLPVTDYDDTMVSSVYNSQTSKWSDCCSFKSEVAPLQS